MVVSHTIFTDFYQHMVLNIESKIFLLFELLKQIDGFKKNLKEKVIGFYA